MRITYDPDRDLARIRFSDERQSYDEGSTEWVLLNDEVGSDLPLIDVQLGFEGGTRLLWMSVSPASVALPGDLLASAETTRE